MISVVPSMIVLIMPSRTIRSTGNGASPRAASDSAFSKPRPPRIWNASREIAPLVGRLYGVNTLGAAVGAAVTGWWLLGELGFVTTVRIAVEQMSRQAAQLFLEHLKSPGEAPSARVLVPRLVVRSSTAAPRAA